MFNFSRRSPESYPTSAERRYIDNMKSAGYSISLDTIRETDEDILTRVRNIALTDKLCSLYGEALENEEDDGRMSVVAEIHENGAGFSFLSAVTLLGKSFVNEVLSEGRGTFVIESPAFAPEQAADFASSLVSSVNAFFSLNSLESAPCTPNISSNGGAFYKQKSGKFSPSGRSERKVFEQNIKTPIEQPLGKSNSPSRFSPSARTSAIQTEIEGGRSRKFPPVKMTNVLDENSINSFNLSIVGYGFAGEEMGQEESDIEEAIENGDMYIALCLSYRGINAIITRSVDEVFAGYDELTSMLNVSNDLNSAQIIDLSDTIESVSSFRKENLKLSTISSS